MRKGRVLGPVRVGWIRVEIGEDHPVFRVMGTVHHRPVSHRVPAVTANRLIADGVPAVVTHLPPDRSPSRHRAA